MAFKDFPLNHKDVYKNQHLHNRTFFEYVKDYASHFDLEKHCVFESQVKKVVKINNEWEVKVNVKGEEQTHHFDYVVVCIGHHHDPWTPTEQDGIKNIENFSGDAIHSSKIWSIQDYVKEK